MLQKIATGIAIVVLVIIGVFSIQNLGKVGVSFLTWAVEMPMIVVILGAYLLGTLTGSSLFGLMKRCFRKTKPPETKPSKSKQPDQADSTSVEG